MEQMAPIQNKSDSIIEEGAPYPPVPPVPHWNPKAKVSSLLESHQPESLKVSLKLKLHEQQKP